MEGGGYTHVALYKKCGRRVYSETAHFGHRSLGHYLLYVNGVTNTPWQRDIEPGASGALGRGLMNIIANIVIGRLLTVRNSSQLAEVLYIHQ
jgi:hypothetical protein